MHQGGLPQEILGLVHLRTSQINGCGPCVRIGVDHAVRAGESPERLHQLAAWHDASCYTDAERAALAVAEAATRLSDRSGPAVPDDVWDEAARHFDERQLAALIVTVSTTNFLNRLNTTTGSRSARRRRPWNATVG
ncbi:carboxymuconolactone decarboxylase family protein [Streptomyces sp. SW4]|nr:carboxymuconolactone decarboxylase family protein [Streptomyces sp. SW4]